MSLGLGVCKEAFVLFTADVSSITFTEGDQIAYISNGSAFMLYRFGEYTCTLSDAMFRQHFFAG